MDVTAAPVLALGTTGAQGSGLLEALSARGARPVRVTSDPARAAAWTARGEVAVVADLADPASLLSGARSTGARAAVLHVPLGLASPDAVGAVVESVATLREAGLAVAVNVGGPVPVQGSPDPTGRRALAAQLADTGATVVSPTGYLENHLAPWTTGKISNGELLYPRPADDVIAWIAARDVTAAAVATLVQDRGGEVLRLAGPDPLTFSVLAQELGAGLGRALVFREVSPQEYGDLLEPYLGAEAAQGVAGFYGAMPRTADPSMSPDAAGVWESLGVEPTPARRWAAEVLAPALGAARH